MPAATRLGDISSGHDCFPGRPNIEASGDVFINGLGAHREGDSWAVHSCETAHDGVLTSGSPTVYVNGRPLGRIGDPISCGDVVAQGSPTVFAG